MANGDQIYFRASGVNHAIQLNKESYNKATFSDVCIITGGTGKFKNIQGITNYTGISDPDRSFNETKGVSEYWFK